MIHIVRPFCVRELGYFALISESGMDHVLGKISMMTGFRQHLLKIFDDYICVITQASWPNVPHSNVPQPIKFGSHLRRNKELGIQG